MKYIRNILGKIVIINLMIVLLTGCKAEKETESVVQLSKDSVVFKTEEVKAVREPKCFIENQISQEPKYNGNLVTKEITYSDDKFVQNLVYDYDENCNLTNVKRFDYRDDKDDFMLVYEEQYEYSEHGYTKEIAFYPLEQSGISVNDLQDNDIELEELIKLIPRNDNKVFYEYDIYGRTVYEHAIYNETEWENDFVYGTDAIGNEEQKVYSEGGKLTGNYLSIIDAYDNEIAYIAYEPDGREKYRYEYDYQYDDKGNMLSRKTDLGDRLQCIEFKYDDRGNCTEEIYKETLYKEEKLQESIIKIVIYNYDDNNKLLEEITEYDDREFRTVYEYLD